LCGERDREDHDCVRHGSRRHRHRRCRRPRPHIPVIRLADNGEITWRSEVISSNYFRAECHEMKPKFDVVAVPLPPAISLSLPLKLSLFKPSLSLSLSLTRGCTPGCVLSFDLGQTTTFRDSQPGGNPCRGGSVGRSVGRLGILKYVRQVKRHMTVHTCEPKDEYHILYCIYIHSDEGNDDARYVCICIIYIYIWVYNYIHIFTYILL